MKLITRARSYKDLSPEGDPHKTYLSAMPLSNIYPFRTFPSSTTSLVM